MDDVAATMLADRRPLFHNPRDLSVRDKLSRILGQRWRKRQRRVEGERGGGGGGQREEEDGRWTYTTMT